VGHLAERKEWLIDPEQINDVLDFCYRTNTEGPITIYPADCLGYYSYREQRTRHMTFHKPGYQVWDGCDAGIRGFGLLSNGDITGCVSLRSREYVEGNLRERPLREIWESEKSFRWRREMTREKLLGYCRTCSHGSQCLGGCPNTRLVMNSDMYSENQYCSYNVALKNSEKELREIFSIAELLQMAQVSVQEGEFQRAAQEAARLLEIDNGNVEALRLKGHADFINGNYELSEEAYRAVLAAAPEDGDAKKGLSLALFKQGKRVAELAEISA
jgi:radical SAM protein with 4Fe4S-binding SPASM domain